MKISRHVVMGFVGFLLTLTVCVAVATLLLPEMPRILKTIVGLWGGFALFIVMLFAVRMIVERVFKHQPDVHENYWETVLAALDRISKGDFSVFLPETGEHFDEMVRAINKMVKGLGDIDKMRTDFISNVSHEIQSPLTSISGFAALLKTDLPEEDRRRYAAIIEMESKRLSGLSDNLMRLSNLDNTTLTRSDYRFDRQIQDAVLALEPQWAAKDITFEVDLHKTVINANADFLHQVLTNLLHNAIKFTPQGGLISVSLNDGVLKIADTGCGIPQDELPRIFERFYKVDKARDRSLGGNGLGLSIVKKILDLHGFAVQVESTVGKGTVFTIRVA